MTCPNCGRYAPPDAVTGYDADELCPDCAREKDDCAKDEAADARRNDWELGVDIIEEDDLESPF